MLYIIDDCMYDVFVNAFRVSYALLLNLPYISIQSICLHRVLIHGPLVLIISFVTYYFAIFPVLFN